MSEQTVPEKKIVKSIPFKAWKAVNNCIWIKEWNEDPIKEMTKSGLALVKYIPSKLEKQQRPEEFGVTGFIGEIVKVGNACPDWVKEGNIITTWSPAPHTRIFVHGVEYYQINWNDILANAKLEDVEDVELSAEEYDHAINAESLEDLKKPFKKPQDWKDTVLGKNTSSTVN